MQAYQDPIGRLAQAIDPNYVPIPLDLNPRERRREPRFQLDHYCVMVRRPKWFTEEPIPTRAILDLSRTGCRLYVQGPVEVEDHLKIRVELPRFADVVELTGWVRRVKDLAPGQSYEITVTFDDLPPKVQRKLGYWEGYFTVS